MKQLLLLLCIFSFVGCEQPLKSETKIVSPQEMQLLLQMESVQLIDVRTPEEYEEGHIPKAQNIDFFSPTFSDDINKLDKEKLVIVYCGSGNRSSKCVEKLKDAGFRKIYDLEGGLSKWKHEGLKVNP